MAGRPDPLAARFATLTTRERAVCRLVVAGHLNKQTAHALGIAVATVKIHRASAMRKLGARSLPDLVRVMDRYDPEVKPCR